jgi:glutaredoxin 3
MEENPSLYESLKAQTGMRTVPQIFINEKFVGGFQELSELNAKGELDKWLAEGDEG